MSSSIPRRPLTYEQALARMARYCSKSEHCESDVRRRLLALEVEPADADRVVEWLKSERFIDHQRYAAAFVREKIAFNRWGVRKIEMELRRKGIDSSVVRAELSMHDDDCFEQQLLPLLRRKAQQVKAATPYERQQKLFRFALGRGYSFEQIKTVLAQCLTDYVEMDD